MTKTLASLATIAVGWLFGAWMLMLGVGIVHAEWIPQLPTIGFPTALLLGFLVAVRGAVSALLTETVKAILGGDR